MIKNVAGYDVSRLIAGSLGILGVIVDVSLKVLPLAAATATLRFDLKRRPTRCAQLNRWGGQPLPINASAWWNGSLVVRLRRCRGRGRARRRSSLGGDVIEPAAAARFWNGLRDHTDEYFAAAATRSRTRTPRSGVCRCRRPRRCSAWPATS